MRAVYLASVLALISAPCLAQQKPESQIIDHGTGFVNEAAELDQIRKQQSMALRGQIKPTTVQVILAREPYMEGDQFALKLRVPDVVSGCFSVSPLEYEATYIDPYFLDIKVKHYERRVTPSQQPHLECEAGYKASEAVIPLSITDLTTRGTRQIKLRTDVITELFDVSFDGLTVTMRPQSAVVFKPQNTVLDLGVATMLRLYVPMAREGEDVRAQLASFAQSNGYAVEPTPEVKRQGVIDNSLIIRDERGALLSQLPPEGGVLQLGTIDVLRPVRNADGVYNARFPLTVFAKPL